MWCVSCTGWGPTREGGALARTSNTAQKATQAPWQGRLLTDIECKVIRKWAIEGIYLDWWWFQDMFRLAIAREFTREEVVVAVEDYETWGKSCGLVSNW